MIVGLLAVSVMKEICIDISGQRSKNFEEFRDKIFDLVVTVCDRARQTCTICSTDLDIPTRGPTRRERWSTGASKIPPPQSRRRSS